MLSVFTFTTPDIHECYGDVNNFINIPLVVDSFSIARRNVQQQTNKSKY